MPCVGATALQSYNDLYMWVETIVTRVLGVRLSRACQVRGIVPPVDLPPVYTLAAVRQLKDMHPLVYKAIPGPTCNDIISAFNDTTSNSTIIITYKY